MAQYTPNFNLYEPDSSDDFADFRTEFNNNMDIIDQNLGGGGGSGGHTIYDPDGNALPQEDDLQFTGACSVTDDNVNGRTVVDILGGNNLILDAKIYSDTEKVVGVWRDNKPLYQRTFVYTPSATISTTTVITTLSSDIEVKDVKGVAVNTLNNRVLPLCYSGNNFGTNFATSASNDLQIEIYGDTWGTNYTFFATVQYTKTTDVAGSGGYEAYGFSPVIYSDVERKIGVWRDNKPLYQRTFHATGYNVGSSPQTLIAINDIPFDYVAVIGQSAYDPNDDRVYEIPNMPSYSGDRIFGHCYLNKASNPVVFYDTFYTGGITYSQLDFSITLQYTKTTDVAGSGDYNTYGVPTVHYSTSEQVIGTWIDGKPLYERTLSLGALPNNSIKTVPHNIANVDLIFVSDSFFQTGAGASSYLNFTNDSTAGQIEILVDKTNIEIWAGSNRSSWNGYATVRYTKTTD